MSDWRSWRVADTDMPARLYNVLMSYEADMTLGALADMTERDARAIPRIGPATWAALMELLRQAQTGNARIRNKTLAEAAMETADE